jgi:hypothetical protein
MPTDDLDDKPVDAAPSAASPETAAPAEKVDAAQDRVADPPPSDKDEQASPADQQPEDKAKPSDKPAARDSLLSKWASDDSKPEDAAADPPAKPADDQPPAADKAGEQDKAPEADPDELTQDDRKAFGQKAQERIHKLVRRAKDAEVRAKLADEIVGFCQQNGFTPEDYRTWVQIGAGLQRNDPRAMGALAAMAKDLGIVEQQTAGPAMTPEFEAMLAKMEENLDISPSAAKALREKLGKPPAPRQQAPPVPQQQAPPAPLQQAPPARWTQQDEIKAVQAIDSHAKAFIAKHGEAAWKQVEGKVKATLAKSAGSHPDAWMPLFKEALATEFGRLPPATKPVTQALSPTKTTTTSKQTFKSERDRILSTFGR